MPIPRAVLSSIFTRQQAVDKGGTCRFSYFTLVQYALRALVAGKCVLSEKPIASSVADARASINAHARVRRSFKVPPVWFVAENFRFEEVFAEAARLAPLLGYPIKLDLVAHTPLNARCGSLVHLFRQKCRCSNAYSPFFGSSVSFLHAFRGVKRCHARFGREGSPSNKHVIEACM
jgi:hypothetical protein